MIPGTISVIKLKYKHQLYEEGKIVVLKALSLSRLIVGRILLCMVDGDQESSIHGWYALTHISAK